MMNGLGVIPLDNSNFKINYRQLNNQSYLTTERGYKNGTWLNLFTMSALLVLQRTCLFQLKTMNITLAL